MKKEKCNKVGFISLGCSKNLVDTEMVIGLFRKHEFEIVNNLNESEIIIINTCGFIESAKQEAINTILEMSNYKSSTCKYLIVMGCLVQRYYEELKKDIPEVDLWIKFDEYDTLWEKVEKLINTKSEYEDAKLDFMDRVITTGSKTAYLKIAEGCSNRCTYCAIPYIRGPLKSRKIEEVIEEAKLLAEKGYEEIIVIAQDTTKYGMDIYGESKLAELLKEIEKIEKIKWIRFLYSYPESITEELIEVVKNSNKICKYFDIPLQHISNSVLKRMNRKSNEKSIRELIEKIRKEIPDCVLRTSLIVGFPGETEEDFEKLYNFVEEIKFDKLGVFMYSKEDNTPAEKLKPQIHYSTKRFRHNKIMKIQQKISNEKLKKLIGTKCEVIIENETCDGKFYVGRTKNDAPDTDGIIYIEKAQNDLTNRIVTCTIIKVKDYDLVGVIE